MGWSITTPVGVCTCPTCNHVEPPEPLEEPMSLGDCIDEIARRLRREA